MSTWQENESIENWDESEITLRELVGEERSPVEESFYESYIIQSRTAVENLYASNVLSCQKHVKVMGDLARQRKVKLLSLEREQKKLLKRMENLKAKQEAHLQKRSETISNHIKSSRFKSAKIEQGDTADNFSSNDCRRVSLPQLHTMTTDTDHASKIVSFDRLSVPGHIHSRSCNDSSSQESILFLPAIKPTRSHENLSGSPFITHFPSKVDKYPHNTNVPDSRELLAGFTESRDSKSTWNEKNFKIEISTKVKWVPRN